jgi:putative addiction module CopG family antidote
LRQNDAPDENRRLRDAAAAACLFLQQNVLSIVDTRCVIGRQEDEVIRIQIAPDIEAKIREKVDTGSYPDADAVLREAMLLLEDRDRKHGWLLAALAEGEKGEAVDFTPERSEQLYQSALRRWEAGEKPSPDVTP